MAGEATGAGNAGAGAPSGAADPTKAVGGGATGGAGGTGTSASGTGAGGSTNPQPVVDIVEEAIPELKGKTTAEKQFILKNLASATRASNAENQRLKAELQKRTSAAVAAEDPKETKGKPKPVEERILEDPAAVIKEVVEGMYGGTVTTINDNVSKVVLRSFRQENEDFAEHEEEVLEILQTAQAPVTADNLQLAYESVLGRKQIQARRIKAAAHNPDVPVDDAASAAKPKIEGVEREVMLAHGMTEEQWLKAKSNEFEIKVPTGKKREETANA